MEFLGVVNFGNQSGTDAAAPEVEKKPAAAPGSAGEWDKINADYRSAKPALEQGRLETLQSELATEKNPDNIASLKREIARSQAVLRAPAAENTNDLVRASLENADNKRARKAGTSGSGTHDLPQLDPNMVWGNPEAPAPAPAPAAPETSSLWRRAADYGLTAVKGAIGVPESAVGLADIATGGSAGKFLEELGFQPKVAKDILDGMYSPEQKAANARVQGAKGFVDTAVEMAKNPSTIAHGIVESAPMMGSGGVAARGLIKAIPAVAPVVAGAFGEGLTQAGSAAEQTRQQTADGKLTGTQSAAAVASGVGTGLLSFVGGKIAQKLGIADIDTVIAGGTTQATAKGFARRMAEGGISEGVFEELPQSAQEQMWSNFALGKPLMDGVPEASAAGMMVGGFQGGGTAAIFHKPGQGAQAPATNPLFNTPAATPAAPAPAPAAAAGMPGAPVTPAAAPAQAEATPAPAAAEVAPAAAPLTTDQTSPTLNQELMLNDGTVVKASPSFSGGEYFDGNGDLIDPSAIKAWRNDGQTQWLQGKRDQATAFDPAAEAAPAAPLLPETKTIKATPGQIAGMGRKRALELMALEDRSAEQEAEYEFLTKNAGNVDTIAKAYGIVPVNAITSATGSAARAAFKESKTAAHEALNGAEGEHLRAVDMLNKASPQANFTPFRESTRNSDEHRAARDEARTLAQFFGKKLFFYEHKASGKDDFQIEGATIDPKTMLMDAKSDKPARVVFGHELTHALRKDAPGLYDWMAGQIVPKADVARYIADFKATHGDTAAQGMADDKITEELLANTVGARFGEDAFWQELARRDPAKFQTVAQRVMRFIDDLIAKIKGSDDKYLKDAAADLEHIRDVVATTVEEYVAILDGITPDMLAEHHLTAADRDDTATLAQAFITDEPAMEQAAEQFANDEPALMEAAQEIINEHQNQQPTDAGAQGSEDAPAKSDETKSVETAHNDGNAKREDHADREGSAEPAAPVAAEPAADDKPKYETDLPLVEHVTKGGKGKTLKGVVAPISLDEAKKFDLFAFKKDDGVFIRERDIARPAATNTPSEAKPAAAAKEGTAETPVQGEDKTAIGEAPAPSKATVVSVYHTKGGKVALEIKQSTAADGQARYSYTGEYGAGSGHDAATMRDIVERTFQQHPGMKVVAGMDFLPAEEPPHPESRAGKAKATRETQKQKQAAIEQEVRDVLGAGEGDTITFTFNGNVGYLTSGKPMEIERIGTDKSIYFRDPVKGGRTSEKLSMLQAFAKNANQLKWEVTPKAAASEADQALQDKYSASVQRWNELAEQYNQGDAATKAKLKPEMDALDIEQRGIKAKVIKDGIKRGSDERKAQAQVEITAKPVGALMRPSEHAEGKGLFWEKTAANEWTGSRRVKPAPMPKWRNLAAWLIWRRPPRMCRPRLLALSPRII